MTQWIYYKVLHTPVEALAAVSQILNTHSPSPMGKGLLGMQAHSAAVPSVPTQPKGHAAGAWTLGRAEEVLESGL